MRLILEILRYVKYVHCSAPHMVPGLQFQNEPCTPCSSLANLNKIEKVIFLDEETTKTYRKKSFWKIAVKKSVIPHTIITGF